MDSTTPPTDFDLQRIQEMNEKAIKNQLFTPDNIYIELGLLKDFHIGVLYTEYLAIRPNEEKFDQVQQTLLRILPDYQKRMYESVEPYFNELGFKDKDIDQMLAHTEIHDQLFILSPTTHFFQTLVRHMVRNTNHSRPAERYTKKSVGNDSYVLEPHTVSFRINTYPLTLSARVLEDFGREFGELFGVNVIFMNKDPATFDKTDWDGWMSKNHCYYLDSFGRFQQSPMVIAKQQDMRFVGTYFFARKRFEREVQSFTSQIDLDHQIQLLTSRMGLFCDFEWLQNNDVRLTDEAEDIPMEEPEVDPQPSPQDET